MSNGYYEDAEIYLTECTHPDHSDLRYLGLDTKKEPTYLGSSVVLKWWITYLGRSHFTKTILDTVSGDMSDCCAVEQEWILNMDAINDPTFLNMNGGRKRGSSTNVLNIDEYIVTPRSNASHDFISKVLEEMAQAQGGNFSANARKFVISVLCIITYGQLKYEQDSFKYSLYTYHCSLDSENVQILLARMNNLGYIEVNGGTITTTDSFIDDIPINLQADGFKSLCIG